MDYYGFGKPWIWGRQFFLGLKWSEPTTRTHLDCSGITMKNSWHKRPLVDRELAGACIWWMFRRCLDAFPSPIFTVWSPRGIVQNCCWLMISSGVKFYVTLPYPGDNHHIFIIFSKSMGIPITANMNQPLRTREFSIRLPRFHPEYFPAVTFAFLNTGAKPGTTETVTKRWRRILNFLIWKCWWKMVEMKSLVNPGVFVPATGLRVSDSCILWYCGYLHNIADGGFPNHQL